MLGLNRTLGPVNAIGVAIVLVASLTLLPALLAILGTARVLAAHRSGRPRPRRRATASGRGSACACAAARRAWLAVLVLGLARLCTAGLLVYHEHANWLLQFRNPTDGTQGYDVAAHALPGRRARAHERCSSSATGGRVTAADVAAVRARVQSVERRARR